MDKYLEKQQKQLEKKEAGLLQTKPKQKNQLDNWIEDVEQKIPTALKNTLNIAFYKGFQVVFEKGGDIIDKTYPKEKMSLEHEVNAFTMNRRLVKRGLGRMDGQSWKSRTLNSCAAFAEGAGLGILGIGLPDIPIFIGVLLKGIYETAVSYGYDYDSEEEKVFILRLIRAALASTENREVCHNEVSSMRELLIAKGSEKEESQSFNSLKGDYTFDLEMKKTAEVLSDAMLFMKFVQGFPIVGIIGSVGNFSIFQKVAKYSSIQYKLRYLKSRNYKKI